MRFEIRYYKRFDADLLALFAQGINLNRYLPDVIEAYAKGREIHLFIPFCQAHELKDFVPTYHSAIEIKDPETAAFLKKIKRGYRNTFCKMLLREALIHQQLSVFIECENGKGMEELAREEARILQTDVSFYDNVIICSAGNEAVHNITALIGNEDNAREDTGLPETAASSYGSAIIYDGASIARPEKSHRSPAASRHLRTMPEPAKNVVPAKTAAENEDETDKVEELMGLFRNMVNKEV